MENFFAWAAYVQGSLLAYFKEGGGVRNKPPPDDVTTQSDPGHRAKSSNARIRSYADAVVAEAGSTS